MSVVQSAMFRDQLDTFGSRHTRTPSYNELLTQFKASITAQKLRSVSPSRTPPGVDSYVKKRSYSDFENELTPKPEAEANKRSRTAPPSPPSTQHFKSERREPTTITLPSIAAALGIPHRAAKTVIPPTVSLDYFDTYKPNDENWRYGLLDLIKNTTPFRLDNYGYLGRHAHLASSPPPKNTKLPSIHELSSGAVRPHFDSRVSPNALPPLAERKINFPYESNYTYLNKTYMTDVERYPEYLELAQSLIQLSRPQPYSPPLKDLDHTSKSTHVHSPPQSHSRTHHNHSHQTVENHSPHEYSQHLHQTQSHQSNSQLTHDAAADSRSSRLPDFAAHYVAPARYTTSPHYYSPKAPVEPYSSFLASPTSSRLPSISHLPYVTPDSSFSEHKVPGLPPLAKKDKSKLQRTRFIPITPPSVKDKSRSELMKSPPRTNQSVVRVCISCGSDQSPCWRPSWSIKEGQLCNSCGLRYKKTAARCLNTECKKIPAKGEWSLMQTKGKTQFEDGDEAHSCLDCGWKVEVKR